ncbi:disintegrin and metalloproteinase domain-containing protein 19-like [Amphibalanus amphitrite]|uniref:disintegrin and metalloproteinase domain-containing protein 19-like n=1 Tax=Amphibalanus amphitrite TaxID=1232801 RepID=UPI001C907A86|nr:disintegrin and metalloproteinase domain-containing protein 19-like [Amphibalanus amphitrite]
MISHGAFKVLPLICLLQTGYSKVWTQDASPDPSFKSFSVVKPVLFHGRTKREILSTRDSDGHVPSITVGLPVLGTNYLLDLELNRDVVSAAAPLRYHRNGSMVTDTRALNEDENCYYSGRVRDVDGSSAAVSTCDGISGYLFDGRRTLFVSPAGADGRHYLYREEELTQNRTCGAPGPPEQPAGAAPHHALRVRRSVSAPRGPYNADRRSRYLELVLVVDQEVFHEYGDDLKATVRRTKQIANIVNSLYTPLNIFVALVGVEVWTEFNEITLSENGDETLTSFLAYRREKLVTAIPNDNAQLLTGTVFQGGVVGKALKGPICTFEFSGGVNMDHSKQVSLVATTVAHEMGHNFGMEHDTKDCECKDDRCIMSPSSSSISPNHWSKCSLNYLTQAFGHGMDYCLRNKPASLYESPVCGNGFVEPGEQCDCGLPDDCQNPCCDAPTCMLREGAVCATGQCCDLTVCRPKRAGVKCRGAEHECDLSEYCTGASEFCPDDVHKQDGLECQGGEAYCYGGVCRTRDKQCQILWGPSGKNSVDNCYYQNARGNRLGNCGYSRLNQTYQKCLNRDVMCGMLHCAHLNERLEFGLESAAIISATFINLEGREVPCRTAIVDLGLRQRDPGLVPNGAPCGHKKMCVEQKCVPVAEVTAGMCPHGCGGNGVCNSAGHCHCDPGWGPPHCLTPGDGGSEDSGPALDQSAAGTFVIILFVVFLGLVPAAALVFCCIYVRRNNIQLSLFQLSSTGARKPGSAGRKQPSKDTFAMEAAVRRPAPASRDPAAPLTQAEAGSKRDQLTNNLVGHFNGFSIRPMKTEETAEPSAPAEPRRVCEVRPTVVRPPQPQDVPRTTFGGLKERDTKAEPRKPGPEKPAPPPQGARTTFDMKKVDRIEKGTKAAEPAADPPSAPPPEPPRPAVAPAPPSAAGSSRTTFGMAAPAARRPAAETKHRDEAAPEQTRPSEARTTFTARGAAKPGDRPPPPPRPTAAATPVAASAPVSPTAPPPVAETARPRSVVNPLEAVPDARSATLRSDTSRSSTLESNRSAGSDRAERPFGSALSRMSGMFRRADKSTPSSPEPERGIHPNQSFKAAKIDRDRLKGLQISAPIPQSVSVPESAVPLPAPASPPPAAAGRAPPLPTSPPGRRAAAARPSAPPPRPPPAPAPAAADEVYDDCNLEAPAAARDSPGGENIYSTIDEPAGDHVYAMPPAEEAAGAGGEDLLSEIAAELRHKDTSLYAAVNKSRARAAAPPPAAVYQNLAETAAPAPPGAAAQRAGRARGAPPALPKKPELRRPPLK